ncbi:MAG: LEPR-XLL domain-containing protein, partial [Burkholderiales bacterium]
MPMLPEIFWGPVANGFRRLAQWRKSGTLGEELKSRRGPAVRLESLEPRLLLSADINYAAASGAVLDAALRIADVDGTQMLQLLDNESNAVLGQEALDEDINVTLSGGDLNDSLIIDFNSGATPHQINVLFDGGAGNDALRGPAENTIWNITGANSGSAGAVSFSGVENLQGAADNEDTFVFAASGNLSGVADGGAGGFDSLVILGSYTTIVFSPTGPDSGSVTLDGAGITYSGLEPVDTTGSAAGNLVLNLTGADEVAFLEDDGVAANGISRLRSGNATFETHTFATPATSLTVNLEDGADTLTLSALDSLFDANVTINAGAGNDDITLSAKTGAGTYTINGQGNTDTVHVTRDANMTLTNTQLTVATDVFGLSGIESAVLTGGA